MKPKDLKYPFSWEERNVIVQDRVWYVPNYYDDYEGFTFPGWEHPDLFGNDNPVCLEYCSGNGTWIANKAAADPHINWVAIEKRFDRVRKIWSKVKNLRLNNLLVICGEGYNVTSCYFPDSSIKEIYINFPDPWPKERHAKHRLIKAPFVQELSRILELEGNLALVTDDLDYSLEMIDTMKGQHNLYPLHSEPYYVTQVKEYGSSFFDELWREKGRVIRYHQYRKQYEDSSQRISQAL